MISLLFAVILSGVTSEQVLEQDYAEAYEVSVKEQKPLMVVVAAPWCKACNVLKASTILPLANSGELDRVSVAVINRDEEPELTEQLTEGEQLLPQIIVFTPDDAGGWKRRRLLGFQPKQPVRNLIQTALHQG